MMLDDDAKAKVVGEASLAPSTHNTQPARWRFNENGSVTILADNRRFLSVCDPTNRDAALSCGAAAEGTLLALANAGSSYEISDVLWEHQEQDDSGMIYCGLLNEKKTGASDPLANFIKARFTWRGRFDAAPHDLKGSLYHWAEDCEDVTLLHRREEIQLLSEFNDNASLITMRDKAFRNELLDWMRLKRSHPGYSLDGLNFESMQMGAVEARLAGVFLTDPIFEMADKLGFAKGLVSENSKTVSATAIALFHRPKDESPFTAGRYFYRTWLNLARLGFAAWPMAVVADHAPTSAEITKRFSIADDRRLITAFRIGIAPKRPPRARLPVAELLLNGQGRY